MKNLPCICGSFDHKTHPTEKTTVGLEMDYVVHCCDCDDDIAREPNLVAARIRRENHYDWHDVHIIETQKLFQA